MATPESAPQRPVPAANVALWPAPGPRDRSGPPYSIALLLYEVCGSEGDVLPRIAHRVAVDDEHRSDEEKNRLIDRAGNRKQGDASDPAQRAWHSSISHHESGCADGSLEKRPNRPPHGAHIRPRTWSGLRTMRLRSSSFARRASKHRCCSTSPDGLRGSWALVCTARTDREGGVTLIPDPGGSTAGTVTIHDFRSLARVTRVEFRCAGQDVGAQIQANLFNPVLTATRVGSLK